MWPQQIILLQEAYKKLNEIKHAKSLPDEEQANLEDAMRDVQKTLQIQGVFVS